jgi:hypothetical protein
VLRAAVVLALALIIALFVAGIPVLFKDVETACAGASCYRWQPTPEVAARLVADGISLHLYAAYYVAVESTLVLGICLIAIVMIWRRPDEPMALFGAFTVAAFGSAFSDPMVALSLTSPVAWVLRTLLATLGWSSLFIYFYMFPDGRFVPRWTRFTALAWFVLMAVTFFSQADWGNNGHTANLRSQPPGPSSALDLFFPIAVFLLFVSVIVAQVYRYLRVSGPIQRRQTTWVVCGFIATFGGLLTLILATPLLPVSWTDSPVFALVGTVVFDVVLLLLPLSFAVAILRYRLYDIDVLINRTLVYGSLTLSIALLYVGGVVLLQALCRALTGQGSNLAVAISTLAIAAAFNPLRRSLQTIIDRRFYRRKYDATRTLAAFQSRLRDEVDLDRLTADLVAVVQETMQPMRVSVWLREGRGAGEPRGVRSTRVEDSVRTVPS